MFPKTHLESQHSVSYAPNKLSLKRKHASRMYVRAPLKIPLTCRKTSFYLCDIICCIFQLVTLAEFYSAAKFFIVIYDFVAIVQHN
jgi:hypothetical protein